MYAVDTLHLKAFGNWLADGSDNPFVLMPRGRGHGVVGWRGALPVTEIFIPGWANVRIRRVERREQYVEVLYGSGVVKDGSVNDEIDQSEKYQPSAKSPGNKSESVCGDHEIRVFHRSNTNWLSMDVERSLATTISNLSLPVFAHWSFWPLKFLAYITPRQSPFWQTFYRISPFW